MHVALQPDGTPRCARSAATHYFSRIFLPIMKKVVGADSHLTYQLVHLLGHLEVDLHVELRLHV